MTDFPSEMRSPNEEGRRNSLALVALAANQREIQREGNWTGLTCESGGGVDGLLLECRQ
jgi:hypothetical protein